MKYTLTYTGKEINTAIGNALNLQEALQDKQDKLTAGDGIQIKEDGTITATVVDKKYIDNNFVKNLGAAADYRVYMASPEGTNTYKSASNSAVPDTIPLRNNSGQIALPNQLIEAPGVNQAISKAYGDTKYLKAGTDINLEKNLEVNGATKLSGGIEPIHKFYFDETSIGNFTSEIDTYIEFYNSSSNEYSFIGAFALDATDYKSLAFGKYSLSEGKIVSASLIYYADNNNIPLYAHFEIDEYLNNDNLIISNINDIFQKPLFTHTLTLTADKSYTLIYSSTNNLEVKSLADLRTIMNINYTDDNVILPICATDLSGTAVLQVTTALCKIGTASVTAVTDKVTEL